MNYEKIIQKIIKKQITLNNKTFPEWEKVLTTDDWITAISHEAHEWSASLGYKWWKKEIPDIDNCKMELIDILHFMISYFHSINPETVYNNTLNLTKVYAIDYNPKRALRNFMQAIYTQDNNIAKYFYSLMGITEMTVEELLKGYFIKNTLNTFRQNNGYKDGTYKKIIQGEEDNVHIMLIANVIPLDEDFEENLYRLYQTFYDANISINVEDNSHYQEM